MLQELGKLGYKYQFVTLAGFHSLNHGMFTLSKGYAARGMAAYSELQQQEFASEKDGYTATRCVILTSSSCLLRCVCSAVSTQPQSESVLAGPGILPEVDVPVLLRRGEVLPGLDLAPSGLHDTHGLMCHSASMAGTSGRWATGYFDLVSTTVSATSSTTAMKESTEAHQF